MPINDYTAGPTFVAFIDISGFKNYMKKGIGQEKLEIFFNKSYQILKDYEDEINSIIISDCAVLFVREPQDELMKLKILLRAIKEINIKMLYENIMLTTSIAYGEFTYVNRMEFRGIIKNKVYGNAYVKAVLDEKKMKPGQCGILKDEELPMDLTIKRNDDIFDFVKTKKYDPKHYYFYWTLSNSNEIADFEKKYKNAYDSTKEIRYNLITNVLKDHKNYMLPRN